MHKIGENDWCTASQKIVGTTIELDIVVNVQADPTATDFHRQADRVACHIANKFKVVPFLALSGGLDSEYVAETLVRNKIEFVPIIMKIGNLNASEYWYAERWCKKHNITPHVLQISADKLVERFEQSVSEDYLTTNVGGFVNVYLADYVKQNCNSVLICGTGDPTVNPYGFYAEGSDATDFYFWDVDLITDILRPKQHPSAFLCYNQDILYSYVYNYDVTLDEQEAKAKLYNIPIRPKSEVFHLLPNLPKLFGHMKFVKTKNFLMGSKNQTLNFLLTK